MDNITMPELPMTNRENTNIPDLALVVSLQKKKNQIRKELHERGILPKGAHNNYDNYDYFSEAQYKELFTELFSKYGIELIIDEVDYGTYDGTDKQPFGRVVTLACTLVDIETGYTETSRHTGEGLDRGDKAGYKATTGAIKKFLSSTFLVATKDDPEREDSKPTEKKTASKNSATKDIKLGTITRGQVAIMKSLFKDSKEELKKMMMPFKKKKIEELTMEEASKIIEEKKGGKTNE